MALIIAIDEYQHCKKLETPVHDGEVLAQILREKYSYTVRELYNGEASGQAILDAIEKLAAESLQSKWDSVIVYYARARGQA
jgi:flagellin-specific chaperone FliS